MHTVRTEHGKKTRPHEGSEQNGDWSDLILEGFAPRRLPFVSIYYSGMGYRARGVSGTLGTGAGIGQGLIGTGLSAGLACGMRTLVGVALGDRAPRLEGREGRGGRDGMEKGVYAVHNDFPASVVINGYRIPASSPPSSHSLPPFWPGPWTKIATRELPHGWRRHG